MPPTIIGLCGARNVGKKSVGEILRQMLPHYETMAFSDAPRVLMWEQNCLMMTKRDVPRHYREIVARYGSWQAANAAEPCVQQEFEHVWRKGLFTFGADCWVDLLWRESIETFADRYDAKRAIIVDVRSSNEAARILAKEGILVNVTRPGFGHEKHELDGARAINCGVSYTIENDGSREDLWARIGEFLCWFHKQA